MKARVLTREDKRNAALGFAVFVVVIVALVLAVKAAFP